MSWSLLVFVAMNFATAASGAIFSPDDWFKNLSKPSWQPPNWAFPVVWTILYLLNAVAGWWVWTATGFEGGGMLAMVVYVISLILNAAWSFLFFGLKRPDWATYEAVLLWLSIVIQMALFYAIVPAAALILIPYIAWVSVAVFLSLTIWRLNPETVPGS